MKARHLVSILVIVGVIAAGVAHYYTNVRYVMPGTWVVLDNVYPLQIKISPERYFESQGPTIYPCDIVIEKDISVLATDGSRNTMSFVARVTLPRRWMHREQLYRAFRPESIEGWLEYEVFNAARWAAIEHHPELERRLYLEATLKTLRQYMTESGYRFLVTQLSIDADPESS